MYLAGVKRHGHGSPAASMFAHFSRGRSPAALTLLNGNRQVANGTRNVLG